MLVVDPEGLPIAGATVYALSTGLDGLDDLADGASWAVTPKDGRVQLSLSGASVVGARHPAFEVATTPVVPQVGREVAVRLELARGFSLRGTILDSQTLQGAPNARVIYTEPGHADEGRWEYPRDPNRVRLWGLTHAHPQTGEFLISGLRAGAYTLEIKAAGYSSALLKAVPVPGPGIEHALHPSGRIVVRIDGWHGSAETVISATARHLASPDLVDGVVTRSPDGVVTIADHLEPGAYEVRVEAQGLGYGIAPARIERPGAAVEVAVALRTFPRVHVDFDGPIPDGAMLRIQDAQGMLRLEPVETALLNRVTLRPVPGSYTIELVAPTGWSLPARVEVGAEADISVRLTLAPVTVIRVQAEHLGSFVCRDAAGRRRELAVFRAGRLAHLGDEVAARAGDVLVVREPGGAQLAALGRKDQAWELEVGRTYNLSATGLDARPVQQPSEAAPR